MSVCGLVYVCVCVCVYAVLLLAQCTFPLQTALVALTEEKDSFLKEQLQDQADDYDAELESLRGLLQKEANEAGSELQRLEDARVGIEHQLAEEKKLHGASKVQGAERLEAAIKDAEARRAREVDDLRRSLTEGAEDQMRGVLAKHSAEMSALVEYSGRQLQEAVEKHQAQIEQEQLDAERLLKSSLLELQEKNSADKKEALTAMENDFTRRMDVMTDEHRGVVETCENEIGELKRSLSLSEQNSSDLTGQLEALHQEKARREEQFVKERDQLLREQEGEIRAERERGEKGVRESIQRAARELEATKDEYRTAMRRQEGTMKDLEEDLDDMHLRLVRALQPW